MKIVYISGPALADCDFPLIREYQQMGHDVMVFMLLAPQNLRSTLIDISHQKSVNGIIKATEYPEFAKYGEYVDMSKFYLTHRTVMHASSYTYYKVIKQQIKMIDNFNPDVVHIMTPPYTFDVLLYKFRKKMVLTMHDPFPHSGEQGFKRELFRKIAFRLCPKLVILNKEQKSDFIREYGIQECRLLVNRLGSYDCINVFTNTTSIKNKNKNVLFFGRISPYKGLEYLLQAMKIVHDKIPDATLTIAGGGKIYFDISEYENLDYIKIINHYVGMQELAELLSNCSVTVCPYTDATQSGVVLTSFGLNKPVIASNVGALGEYIEDGITGILIPPRNVNELAESITQVLTNEDLLNNMAENIKKRNRDNANSWNAIAEKYIEFYKKKI